MRRGKIIVNILGMALVLVTIAAVLGGLLPTSLPFIGFACPSQALAQNVPDLAWSRTFGWAEADDQGNSVDQTSDGGYIIAGDTCSLAGGADVWLIKTDSTGNKLWDKTFSGAYDDWGYSVQQTSDDGYIITGCTACYGADGYNYDVWLIKTNPIGNKLWDKTFGGAQDDLGLSVEQTSDGGYIIAGYTASYGDSGDDVWLIKTDSSGNKLWDKTFGGVDNDYGYSVQQTSDDGYIIAGDTWSSAAAGYDVWLIKTDSSGNKLWDKTFSAGGYDSADSVQQTSDGGYIIAGVTDSYGADGDDVWLIKTDSTGSKLWDKTFGGADAAEYGQSVQQTSDGGYIIAGYAAFYAVLTWDVWLIKTDSSGNKLWDKTIGGAGYDAGYSVQQTSDGGYIIAGLTDSYGVGKDDVWLIKVKGEANNPPNTPSNLSPANDATGVSINADLSWSGGDPDGDTVTYDVYFGTNATPPLVSNDQLGTVYDPGTLAYNTTYYWQIVATDNPGASTTGPVWDFTTQVPTGPTVTWNLPWGLDEDPTAINIYTYVGVAVNLSAVDATMPNGLLIWYYGGPGVGYKFYKKGWGDYNTLKTLVPNAGVFGIVPTASVWNIPQS